MPEWSLSTVKNLTLLITIGVVSVLGLGIIAYFGGISTEVRSCQPPDGILTKFQPNNEQGRVPNNTFVGTKGSKHRLSDYSGKGVVLNFWATWCNPCVREMPQLDRLHSILKSQDIYVLAVSQDGKGLPIAEKFYKTNKLKHLKVFADPKGTLLKAMGAKGIPTTIVIDRKGNEVGRVIGIAEWDAPEIIRFLKRCLGA